MSVPELQQTERAQINEVPAGDAPSELDPIIQGVEALRTSIQAQAAAFGAAPPAEDQRDGIMQRAALKITSLLERVKELETSQEKMENQLTEQTKQAAIVHNLALQEFKQNLTKVEKEAQKDIAQAKQEANSYQKTATLAEGKALALVPQVKTLTEQLVKVNDLNRTTEEKVKIANLAATKATKDLYNATAQINDLTKRLETSKQQLKTFLNEIPGIGKQLEELNNKLPDGTIPVRKTGAGEKALNKLLD